MAAGLHDSIIFKRVYVPLNAVALATGNPMNISRFRIMPISLKCTLSWAATGLIRTVGYVARAPRNQPAAHVQATEFEQSFGQQRVECGG